MKYHLRRSDHRTAFGPQCEACALLFGAERPDEAKLAVLDRYPRLSLPFASIEDPAVEKYVITHGKLEPEYYIGIVRG